MCSICNGHTLCMCTALGTRWAGLWNTSMHGHRARTVYSTPLKEKKLVAALYAPRPTLLRVIAPTGTHVDRAGPA